MLLWAFFLSKNCPKCSLVSNAGGRLLPYIGYMGMRSLKRVGFFSHKLLTNRVWFSHSSLEILATFLGKSYFFVIIKKITTKSPSLVIIINVLEFELTVKLIVRHRCSPPLVWATVPFADLEFEPWTELFTSHFNELGRRSERTIKQCHEKWSFLHTLILGNKKQTSQKKIENTYFLNNVGSHAKNQPLLGTNEKRPKVSVRTFLPGALQLCLGAIPHETRENSIFSN